MTLCDNLHKQVFINPRRACAARVTVVVFCLSVCYHVFRRYIRAKRRPISDTNGFSATLALFLKQRFFGKNAAFESYGVKQSEEANMQISTGLPRPALRTLEAPKVAMQGER